MPRDPDKARASKLRYRARKHAERFGEGAGDQRGRHGNHARGTANGKWAGDRLITSQGYVAVRVTVDHPHGWGPPGLVGFKYAYEHVVVAMEKLGRPLNRDEVAHHINGRRDDNRPENIDVLTRSDHAVEHADLAPRDEAGRFMPGNPGSRSGDMAEWPADLRVREWPMAVRS